MSTVSPESEYEEFNILNVVLCRKMVYVPQND